MGNLWAVRYESRQIAEEGRKERGRRRKRDRDRGRERGKYSEYKELSLRLNLQPFLGQLLPASATIISCGFAAFDPLWGLLCHICHMPHSKAGGGRRGIAYIWQPSFGS